jgi:hypothetical protein
VIVAIVGSRWPHFADPRAVAEYVLSLPEGTEVLSGGAPGVDTWAVQVADDVMRFGCTIFRADWDRYGRSAGPRRNADIVRTADRVVAFWDGKSPGTFDTLRKAREAGKPVEVHRAVERIP